MIVFPAGRSAASGRAEELAAAPGAAYWALVCGWVPGTGHCRDRDCPHACVFRHQREAEARQVARWRRLRRIFVRPLVR